ncbi:MULTISPECIES: serine hydrolase domain-containing protein [Empedobacter]|uniref:serine hydrolase domain-containing protein n=1 Tax=Empedobacter TaxID=59734 RepID=UPI002574AE70|nr:MULTISPECIES: serine hydrolase [Empedobacter]MDM1040201.1 serine hydrolase [Empedobacter brevis]MDM1134133.1 serine hydrolase [Empedobacter sp. R750]
MAKHLPENLIEQIEKEYKNITGIVVQRNNEITHESYFQGYAQNDTIHIASVTKSIISILIGIAIDKGLIQSVEQNVLDFFPEYQIKRGEKSIQNIKIEHLLTMTAPYKFKSEPYTKVYSSENWTKSVLDLLGGKSIETEFKYTTIGLQVLSGIIAKATRQSVLDFATENLFIPLAIQKPDSLQLHNKEQHIDFIKGKNKNSWVISPEGINTAGWGLTLTARDMTKIGQLYLNKGKWENQQILSSKWIEESTKKHSSFGSLSYGYLWWIIDDMENNCFAAIGDSGNIIYVNPKDTMVISISSTFFPRAKNRVEFIRNILIPSIGII